MKRSPEETDYESFVRLLAEHESAIFGYILSLLPNWSDAQDVYQETSVVLWRKFSGFDPESSFAAWACTTARFKALNRMKKAGRDRHVFSDELLEYIADEGIEALDRLEAERKALHQCLQSLSKTDRDMVEGCYDPGATMKQFAESIGRTPNSVYKWLNRVREGLLDCIERRLTAEGFS
ncbi:MAG: sigma-70 family RNA polymerase sigma factor [Verrucomicrobiota bacterium]